MTNLFGQTMNHLVECQGNITESVVRLNKYWSKQEWVRKISPRKCSPILGCRPVSFEGWKWPRFLIARNRRPLSPNTEGRFQSMKDWRTCFWKRENLQKECNDFVFVGFDESANDAQGSETEVFETSVCTRIKFKRIISIQGLPLGAEKRIKKERNMSLKEKLTSIRVRSDALQKRQGVANSIWLE